MAVEARKREKSKMTPGFLAWLTEPSLPNVLRPLPVCILNDCLYISLLCKLFDRKVQFTPIFTSQCLIMSSAKGKDQC